MRLSSFARLAAYVFLFANLRTGRDFKIGDGHLNLVFSEDGGDSLDRFVK